MTDGSSPLLRIGILGAARIARKNALAIGFAESGCIVSAVASRTLSKAEEMVNRYVEAGEQNVRIYGGANAYDDLVNSQNVCDAIYIPLPTSMHLEWVCKALKAGKHVLVEKPVSLCVEDYEEMLQVAHQAGKLLMDGTMFHHHSRTADVVKCARDESRVGTVNRIETCFSFLGDDDFFQNDIRTQKDGDPLGCLGDLGWYCIRIALLVFPTSPTSAKVVDCKMTDDGVPIQASCLVNFEGGRVLFFHCGFLMPFRQELEICGTKKSIKMDDYVLPKRAPLKYELHSMSLTHCDLITIHEHESVLCDQAVPVQEVLLWQTFSKLAGGGWSEKAKALSTMSLKNQQIVNALMESIQQGEREVYV